MPGKYRLLQDFAIQECVKHGGGFEGSGCLEQGTRIYKAGEIIDVETFFWDRQGKECGAKVVVFNTFRSIPVGLLVRVR